ncbi:MAG: hypothetical protein GEV13_30500 [Rhodospirillales bacterium]|nr:hypothetical protein [Rhodospirillales bacterium]
MSAAEPGFHAASTGALKRGGVKGKRVAVTMRARRLGIVGEEGAIWIDPADVASVRIGYEESKVGKQFLTRIVRKSRLEPLVLHPVGHYDRDYGATIRAFSGAVVESGGIERIERGASAFWAWAGPVLTGLLMVAGVGLIALANHVWWQRFAPALVGAILFGVTLWNAQTRLGRQTGAPPC